MSKRSLIWEFFDKDPSNSKIINCNICKKAIITKGNTTNLHSHLRIRHPIQYVSLQRMGRRKSADSDDEESGCSQLTETELESTSLEPEVVIEESLSPTILSDFRVGPIPSTSNSFSKKQPTIECFALNRKQASKIDRALAYFIAIDMQPYSIVENDGFRQFLKVIQPSYSTPSRKSLAEVKIPQLYMETVNFMKSVLHETKYISCTTDAWTSNSNKPFVSLTAHFILNWSLKSFCLNCREMSEDHTGENWANVIRDLFDEWEIAVDKIGAFTTDCGSNAIKCVEILDLPRISCLGHTLNTAVCKALEHEDLKICLNKVRKIQNLFAHSWKMERELSNYQKQYNLPLKKIPSYSKTRWWSLLKLIEVIVEQQMALMSLLQEYQRGKHKELILTITEIDILKDVAIILKPIQNTSDIMAGEKYVTASVVLPIWSEIKNQLYSIDTDETQLDSSVNVIKVHFAQTIISYMEDRYTISKITNQYLAKCTFLDPRFKGDKVSSSSLMATLKKEILDEMDALVLAEESIKKKKRTSGLSLILGRRDQQRCAEQSNTTEFDRYVNIPSIDLSEDPLEWWQINQGHYPKLSILATKYLCTQATSVASERVFSKGGLVISDNRASLTTEHSEQLIFLSMNKEYVKK